MSVNSPIFVFLGPCEEKRDSLYLGERRGVGESGAKREETVCSASGMKMCVCR